MVAYAHASCCIPAELYTLPLSEIDVVGYSVYFLLVVFFFQAEDGIRDYKVTGVQTCALPICGETRRCSTRAGTSASRRLPRHLSMPARSARAARRRRASPEHRRSQSACRQIGRASCRGRGEISVVAASFKKKKKKRSRRGIDS